MFGAVIFDCDGVLVDSEIIAVEVEIASLAEIGLKYERGEFKSRFMGMSDEQFFSLLNSDSILHLGTPLPTGFREIINFRKQALFDEQLIEISGASLCIEKIHLPKAVASSGSVAGISAKLRKIGLWDHFSPHVYSAEHVSRGKPEPDLFLYAAQRLGVTASSCVVIEDSVNGIRAAISAGMTAWGFAAGRHMDKEMIAKLSSAGAARIVSDWAEASMLLAASS